MLARTKDAPFRVIPPEILRFPISPLLPGIEVTQVPDMSPRSLVQITKTTSNAGQIRLSDYLKKPFVLAFLLSVLLLAFVCSPLLCFPPAYSVQNILPS